jgi:hypothetical protein
MGLIQLLTDPAGGAPLKNLTFGDNKPYILTPPPEKAKYFDVIDYTAGELELFPNLDLFGGGGGGSFNYGINLNGDWSGTTFKKGNLFPYLGSLFTSIPSKIRYNPQSWGPDFLNRGNQFGILRAIEDIERLTKYFTDLKGSGPLFIIKQNLLSRVGARTESTYISAVYGGGLLNEGVYTPTSTIFQAASGIVGMFSNKQGIDPTGLSPGSTNQLEIRKYQDAIYRRQIKDNETNKNRLVTLNNKSYQYGAFTEDDIANSRKEGFSIIPNINTLMRYGGGPGSVYGIGYTNIRYATDSTGKNPSRVLTTFKDLVEIHNKSKSSPFSLTWGRENFANTTSSFDSLYEPQPDFRQTIQNNLKLLSVNDASIIGIPSTTSSSYSEYNIEKRINLGNPSKRGNRSDPFSGKYRIGSATPLEKEGAQDKINASKIYKAETWSLGKSNTDRKDLIDFVIGVYDNSSIGSPSTNIKLNFMHFRVFLKGFSDNYDGEWKAQTYVGRGESFYKYNKFKRDISFSFIVAASTMEELNPIYTKLNYLASTLAPYYSLEGYMSGNFHQITLGNWLNRQPGFISSIDLTIPDESPWEVNLLDNPNTQQLPHMVEVKIKFTPIHRFRPSIQSNPAGDNSKFFSKFISDIKDEEPSDDDKEEVDDGGSVFITDENGFTVIEEEILSYPIPVDDGGSVFITDENGFTVIEEED